VKTFTVFANCQSHALAKTLLEHQDFSQNYKLLPIPAVHELRDVDIEKVIDVVKQVDLFLYQPVASKEHRLESATSKYMLKQLKDSAQALSFPSIYFDGYFPHLATLGGYHSVLNQVHDYFIAYCFVKGMTAENCVELISSRQLYDKSTSRKLLKNTLSSLKWRERFNRIDLKVSGFIEKNYKTKRLFNQFNHPTRDIFVHLRNIILHKVGIDDGVNIAQELNASNYLSGIIAPIYTSTYYHLDLCLDESYDKYIVKSNAIELYEVVCQFYLFYQGVNKDELIKTIYTNKPFVVKRVDKLC
jgi:hypothetical protein